MENKDVKQGKIRFKRERIDGKKRKKKKKKTVVMIQLIMGEIKSK